MEKDKALEEAEKLIKWVARWVGDFNPPASEYNTSGFGQQVIVIN